MFTTDKKEEIYRRLALELEHSNVTQARAATLLGMSPVYFSKIKDKFQWKSIPESVWVRWCAWEESGSSFTEYADDCGTEFHPIKEKRGPKPTNGKVQKEDGVHSPSIDTTTLPPVREVKSEDHLEVIAERVEKLKGLGYIVEFKLTLLP